MDEKLRMIRRAISVLTCTLMLLIISIAASPVLAANNGDTASNNVAVNETIATGIALENQGHWSDALILYQQALRANPNDKQLQHRRSLARLHYDLDRRQTDSSFLAQVQATSGTSAQNLYSEILLKIQSYYVDEPDWNEIARFGLTSLKLALKSPEYQQRYLSNATSAQIDKSFEDLTTSLNKYVVQQRTDVAWVSGHCAEHLQKTVGLPPQACIFEFICGAVSALDPYSAFLSDSQYGETMSQIEGNFVGLGVELKTQDNSLDIVNVIGGGPASQAGVLAGDRIMAVNGQLISNIGSDVGADMLRGIEGSKVVISIERNSKTSDVQVVRRRVEIPSVDNIQIVDATSGVGYLRITSFQKTTARDFDQALWQLQKSGMRSLIMDLRGNPGGLLTAAVEVADRFVANGVLVSTRGRNPLEDFTHRASPAGTWNVPLVVLVDNNSASASEILAAAIHDHKRGQIVGETSYGKGSVQGIFPLNISGGGIRLTTAKFYSPTGSVINQVGVKPDVEIVQTARPAFEDQLANSASAQNDDNVLRAAISLARKSQPVNPTANSVAGR